MKYKVAYVYFVLLKGRPRIKIGISTDLPSRVHYLRGNLLAAVPVLDVEKTLHERFSRFALGNETFEPDQEIFQFIKDLCESMEPIFQFADEYGEPMMDGVPRGTGDRIGRNLLTKILRGNPRSGSKPSAASRLSRNKRHRLPGKRDMYLVSRRACGETPTEIAKATGRPIEEVDAALKRFDDYKAEATKR